MDLRFKYQHKDLNQRQRVYGGSGSATIYSPATCTALCKVCYSPLGYRCHDNEAQCCASHPQEA